MPELMPSPTLLVVEDDPMVRRIAVDTLRRVAYTVLEAADGLEAVALVEPNAAALVLVISDIRMPNMDGLELAQRLWQTHPRIKVLLISGYGAEMFSEIQHGCLPPAPFSKPFRPAILLEEVQKMLNV